MTDPTPDLLDLVRDRCRHVATEARLVRIDEGRLEAYAGTLSNREEPDAPHPDPDELTHEVDPWAAPPRAVGIDAHADDEERVALVVTLDAINFGSGYHPYVAKLDGLSGARTMATRLRTWATEQDGVDAERLTGLDRADAHRIFGQPESVEMVELMGLFTTALNELGQVVADRFDGSFLTLVAAARGSAGRLVAELATLATYADVSTYRGVEVPFYKRAQITAADLHRAFDGTGPGAFADLDHLTAFADNLVPHVLRVDGVLVLDPDLAAYIDRGELLVHGDEPEVELRGVGVDAVERLCAVRRHAGTPTNAAAVDQVLWERGGRARYKAIPRPRARSSAY